MSNIMVRERPWTNLGNSIEGAKSSSQAIQLAGLDWKVESKPLYTAEGDKVKGHRANIRDSDGSVLGVVTNRYKIVQNEEAFAFTDMLLGEGVKYETAGSSPDGKRVWMLARMDTVTVLGDMIEPYLVFTNSHDGKGAVKVAMTPIRVVCDNAFTAVFRGAQRTWSTRHMGDIMGKLDDAQKTLELAHKYVDGMEENADNLTQIVIPHPLLIEYLYKMFPTNNEMSERQKANAEFQRNGLKDLYENKDDISRFKGTAYGLLLAAGDYMTHFKPLRQTASYRENNFMNIVDGGNIIDKTCDFIEKVSKAA